MSNQCPQCKQAAPRNSSYIRKCDQQKIVQYRCFRCKHTWSTASGTIDYRQRRRSENRTLRSILVSCVSMRRAAELVGVNRKTVARRIPYFAKLARIELRVQMLLRSPSNEFYFDELITYEHTRCKPLAVCVVTNERREILSFSVSAMPAIGKHLKQIALRKYGKRPNLRTKGIKQCLAEIGGSATVNSVFHTDEEHSYTRILKRKFPESKHYRYPSKRAVIAGQGELKDAFPDQPYVCNA